MPKIFTAAMAYELPVAVCDACVLYPFHLRNILVQAAVDRLFQARWTDAIHAEWMRNLAASLPDGALSRLQRTRLLMESALPDANVSGYDAFIPALNLPDPDDRHVAAAAIVAKASLILTWNLRDFPAEALREHGIEARSPDAFLTELFDRQPALMIASLANARRNLAHSRVSASAFIDILAGQRLVQLANRVKNQQAAL